MIHLSRPAAPHYLHSPEVEALRSEVQAFYTRTERTRRQERMEFPLFPKGGFVSLLEHLFTITSGKCAYCESPAPVGASASLDRFRPKAGAMGLDGEFSTEHYWWLAYEWDNLYPSCPKCNKFKGPKFPVRGPRAVTGATGAVLNQEGRLLVDPFTDEPTTHFSFEVDGTIKALTEMGENSISTFELNRSDLVVARQDAAQKAMHFLARADLPNVPSDRAELRRRWLALSERGGGSGIAALVGRAAPWSAAARAVLDRWSMSAMPAHQIHSVAGPTAFGSTRRERRLITKARALSSQRVTRVSIHNFKGIDNLDLQIAVEPGRGAPWTALLGENGTGKSSILHAIALALLDAKASSPTLPKPTTVLRKGTTRGWVKVWLDEGSEPRVLAFSKGARTFKRSGPTFNAILLGYGATRLLPKHSRTAPRSRVRVQSMFDPFHPLLDASRWLGQLDARSFDYVARTLKDALDLPRTARLRRLKSRSSPGVRLKLFGAELSLEELSDGYQSVLGLTCDIISSLEASTKGALDGAEGLVLLDELGAHLHPRWRMRIVDSMRKGFPRIQFLASTHDPLCLRGLENGEAVVLRRAKRGRIFALPDLPPIKGLHADQLLTSEYFGLSSTLDPNVERKYNELYRLLAIRAPNEKQLARIAELQTALEPYHLPGETRRERRLLQIIDRELAQLDAEPDLDERQAIRASSDRMVTELNALLAQRVHP